MSSSGRIQWRPPKPTAQFSKFAERCRTAKEQPYLDERFMDDAVTDCAWENFRRPRLGRFKKDGPIAFTELLGYGLDGIVWKVNVGEHVYALKVFWDNRPPPEDTRYWALQRECHNASLLERSRYVIERSSEPVWLSPKPQTPTDAALNLHAFSDEGRKRQLLRNVPGAVEYNAVPHLRRCHGWMEISGNELCALPSTLKAPWIKLNGSVRRISPSEEYHSIVYEYMSESDSVLDTDAVQAQLDFFWLAGFCLVPLRKENWKGPGVLLDMADLICPWHAGWFTSLYKRRYAAEIIREGS